MKYDELAELNPYSSVEMDINNIEESDKVLKKILKSDVILSPRHIDKEIILYGAGVLGMMAYKFFNQFNIPFLYFIDKNSELIKLNPEWKGINIIKPSEVKEENKKKCMLVLCIVKTPLIALRDEIKSEGWKDVIFFYDMCEAYSDRYPLSNGWFLKKLNKKNIIAIKKIFSKFDIVSRMHYLQFLAWRKLRIEFLFKNIEINLNKKFFIHEVTSILHEKEIFVDCGAHFGEVTKKFIDLINKKYKKIYTFEADKDSFKDLENNLRDFPEIINFKYALSDKNGDQKFFQGFDAISKLGKSGNDIVKCVTLDSLNIPATFIKIHLEGGELLTLRGAKNTIKKYRPILAVTIYHNSDGVWKIPLFLISITKNYYYYIRLHTWGGTAVVFYAVPKERDNKV